jgi:hypothetical protein
MGVGADGVGVTFIGVQVVRVKMEEAINSPCINRNFISSFMGVRIRLNFTPELPGKGKCDNKDNRSDQDTQSSVNSYCFLALNFCQIRRSRLAFLLLIKLYHENYFFSNACGDYPILAA